MNSTKPCWIRDLTLLALAVAFVCLGDVASAGDSSDSSDSAPLSLEACLARAMKSSPALESAYRNYLAATHLKPQANALPEPQVSWTHFLEQVQTRTGPQENAFMISQTIPWFGKLKLRGEAASHEAEAARHRFEETRIRLVEEVALAWLEYAYLAKETTITAESRDLLAKLVPITEEQIRAGAPLTQKLTLELALGRMESQLDDFSGRRAESSARLKAAMGESAVDSKPLPWPTLPEGDTSIDEDFADFARELRARHPLLASLDEEISKADSNARLAHKNAIPDPTIGANVIDIGAQGDTAAGIMIGFRIPLAFKKYRAERAEAAERKAAAEAKRADAETKLLAELTGAWERLLSQARTVKRYRSELLPAAEQIIEVSEASYRADSATIRDVIDDQRDALDVRKNYWRAIADFHSAAIRIETLAGNPDPSLSLP